MERPSKRPKRNAGALSSTRLLNTDSPVTKPETDIQSFLSLCLLNWSQYSEIQKQHIISKLPTTYQNVEQDAEGNIVCPITPSFVASDKTIRDQIARFKRDVMDGCYTKTWQEKARKAMEDRMNGKFDEYIAQHAAELFDDAGEDDKEVESVSSDGDYHSTKKGKRKGKSRQNRKTSRLMSTLHDGRLVEDDVDGIDELAT